MQDSAGLTRKERERIQRKAEIQKAAAELFSKKGYANTTLEEIAVKAEFGIGTIYNYFQNKEEIMLSIIDTIFETTFEITLNAGEESSNLVEFIKHHIRRIYEYCLDNKAELLIMVYYYTAIESAPFNNKKIFSLKHSLLDDTLLKKMEEGVENNEIRRVNPQKLFYFYHGILFPYIMMLFKENKLSRENYNEHIEFVLDVLFNGILEK